MASSYFPHLTPNPTKRSMERQKDIRELLPHVLAHCPPEDRDTQEIIAAQYVSFTIHLLDQIEKQSPIVIMVPDDFMKDAKP